MKITIIGKKEELLTCFIIFIITQKITFYREYYS